MSTTDAEGPLAGFRDRFVGSETTLVYLDGNSLGRPLQASVERLARFAEHEWGGRLIRGWDEGWFDLPTTLGDRLGAAVLGAAPGQTVVADSTSVMLYKLLRAALALHPASPGGVEGRVEGRVEVVAARADFPTDRYLTAAVAAECDAEMRWLEPDPDPAVGVTLDALRAAISERTALVVLSHVDYRSAWLADLAALTHAAHEVGALVLWDLSHSAGAVEIGLDDAQVDLAVGCTYKYLGGGPGSPAFGYVAQRWHEGLSQPIVGWMGAADPFAMGPDYEPAPGVRRLVSGTPPVLAMVPLADQLEVIEEAGIGRIRAASTRLTEHAIALADELLPDCELASPRDPERRGGHVTLHHPQMREVVARLWRRDVLPDYRDPGGLRLGLSPLSTSLAEVEAGVAQVRAVLDELR